jgi:hypothetical protein
MINLDKYWKRAKDLEESSSEGSHLTVEAHRTRRRAIFIQALFGEVAAASIASVAGYRQSSGIYYLNFKKELDPEARNAVSTIQREIQEELNERK